MCLELKYGPTVARRGGGSRTTETGPGEVLVCSVLFEIKFETWNIGRRKRNKIEALEIWVSRTLQGIKRTDRVGNDDILINMTEKVGGWIIIREEDIKTKERA